MEIILVFICVLFAIYIALSYEPYKHRIDRVRQLFLICPTQSFTAVEIHYITSIKYSDIYAALECLERDKIIAGRAINRAHAINQREYFACSSMEQK